MKHAREDYNERIIDTARLIPENEPVFLFRGQDELAPQVLEFYADLLADQKRALELDISAYETEYGQDEDSVEMRGRRDNLEAMEIATRKQASEMRLWQTHKMPDMQLKLPMTNTIED